MHIKWEAYEKNNFPIDYYSITLNDDGAVVKSRVYYKIDGSTITSINPIFDELILHHHLQCFSMGKEENLNYIKYDFKVNCEDKNYILEHITSKLTFCSKTLLDDLQCVLNKNSNKFYFRILGSTIEPSSKNINSACFYFYTNEKISIVQQSKLINAFLYITLGEANSQKKICWPICNENGYLCFIAIDFFPETYKIKFYFEFLHEYDQNNFVNCFNGTKAVNIVSDIVSTNARVEGFQVAITKKGQISYNFYLKKK